MVTLLEQNIRSLLHVTYQVNLELNTNIKIQEDNKWGTKSL